MDHYLEKLEDSRKSLVELTRDLSAEQFNLIPPHRNNNVIWNIGHMLAVSENILYKNSDLKRPLHKFEISRFGGFTKPEQPLTIEEILQVRDAIEKTVLIFKKANNTGDAINMPAKRLKHMVSEDALQFLLFHEVIHYRAIVRILQQI